MDRFLDAQNAGGTYDAALAELRRGRKTGHWMWFVFPQLRGLGRSATAAHYAIADLAEARDYLAHPVLGARLRAAAQVLLEGEEDDADRLLGGIDAVKLRSSMTLFAAADPRETAFPAVLDRFYGGQRDPRTWDLLEA